MLFLNTRLKCWGKFSRNLRKLFCLCPIHCQYMPEVLFPCMIKLLGRSVINHLKFHFSSLFYEFCLGPNLHFWQCCCPHEENNLKTRNHSDFIIYHCMNIKCKYASGVLGLGITVYILTIYVIYFTGITVYILTISVIYFTGITVYILTKSVIYFTGITVYILTISVIYFWNGLLI